MEIVRNELQSFHHALPVVFLDFTVRDGEDGAMNRICIGYLGSLLPGRFQYSSPGSVSIRVRLSTNISLALVTLLQ